MAEGVSAVTVGYAEMYRNSSRGRNMSPAIQVTSRPELASRERIDVLDGLRGVLSLYVCFYHLTNSFPLLVDWFGTHAPILRNGWFAVDVFFVLSGFVMSYVYQSTFRTRATWADFKFYFVSRFARLYPVHLLTFLILFVAVTPFVAGSALFNDYAGRFSWIAAIANVFMLHGPWIDHRTWDYPSWSISAEMHVYLLLPLLARFFLTKTFALIAMIGCVIGALLIYLFGGNSEIFPTNGLLVLPRAGFLFVAGMASYTLRDTAAGIGNAAVLAVLAMLFLLLSFESIAPYAVLLTPLLVVGTLGNNLLHKTLVYPWALHLGRISYSVYMIHAVVQILIVDRLRHVLGTQESLITAVLVLIAAVIVSVVAAELLNRYVEVPGREKLRRFLLPKRAVVSLGSR